MKLLLHFVFLLAVIQSNLSFSLNDIRFKFLKLESSNLKLTARIASIETSNKNLESSNLKLADRIASIETSNLTSRIISIESSNKNLTSNNHTLSRKIKVLQSMLSSISCGPCTAVFEYLLNDKYSCDCRKLAPKRDCLAFHQAGLMLNGLYKVTLGDIKILEVYCDQTTDGGGWTVIQRRIDGSTNFYRNWSEYKKGFGHIENEFYMGNSNLHNLTSNNGQGKSNKIMLRIDMEDWHGNSSYAKYNSFQIDDEISKFRLSISGYSGNAGDALDLHNGMKFSTNDQDNDEAAYSCARDRHGAWWYKRCGYTGLNGEYLSFDQLVPTRGVIWYHWQENMVSLKSVEMKIRRKS